MRIVYVLTSLGMGGAERQALAVAERMAGRGHSVAVIALMPRLPEEWPTRLKVCYLGMRRGPLSLATGLVRARRFLGGFKPEILHSHSFHANIFARLLKIFLLRAVVLSTVHNVYEGDWTRMAAYRITDALARQTTAVSQAAADRFVRMRAVPRRKCTAIPNAIDLTEFSPQAGRGAQTRAGIEPEGPDGFVWLACGRIAPAKDYPNLLGAFAQVCAEFPNARLWIASEVAGPHSAAIQALAAELGVAERIRWLGLRRDMPALLEAADGFVLASAWEGMPLAVGEAMAMEKPVVATDVGGVRELLGETGTIVPPKDAGALARGMLAMMRRPADLRREQGIAARMRIAGRFSMDVRTAEWEALYKTLLEG